MARWTSKHTTFFLLDLSEALSLEAGPGNGEITVSNIAENNRDTATVRSRGGIDGRVYTDELEQEISITVDLRNEELVHAVKNRVLNAILKRGAWAMAQTCDPGRQVYALTLRVRLKDEAGNLEWLEFGNVRFMGELSIVAEGGTLTLSGSNAATPLIGTAEVFA